MTWRSQIADGTTAVAAALLRLVGPTFARHVGTGLYERFPRGQDRWDVKIHCPSPVEIDAADKEIVDRIFHAFKKAKRDQQQRDPVFLPSSMWQDQLDTAFAPLNGDDQRSFHRFLANFGSSDEYTGIEHSTLIRDCSRHSLSRIRVEKHAVPRLLLEWTERESKGRPLDSLATPLYGNLVGVKIDDVIVSLNAFAYDVGSRMVTSFLANRSSVILAELGGGYGGWVPFLDRQTRDMTYIDFDLPETLCCAAYYLMKVFPHKRFLLYGEKEFRPECLEEYDFILLPSFEMTALSDRSVDLFLNSASLSEMRPATARRYLKEIGRTAEGFWHVNHESKRNEFADGSTSLLNDEYDLPDDFLLMSRHYFTWSVLYYLYPEGWDYYWYLYHRQDRASQAPQTSSP